jgi:tRNA nucleotidyltransferase (CCA-adding enzyme)
MGRECHDVDIALDTHTGVQFAQYVNDFLAASGHPVSKIGTIAANPEQSKHLETATVKVLGRFVDFVNLRSERYSGDSRIPVMVSCPSTYPPCPRWLWGNGCVSPIG